MADIQQLFATTGALPQTYEFDVDRTSPFLLYIAGSCFSTKENELIGAGVFVDGEALGAISVFANEANSHKPLPAQIFALQTTIGRHKLELKALPDSSTVSDNNDWWTGAELSFGTVKPFVWKTTGPLTKTTTFNSNVLGPALIFLSGSAFLAGGIGRASVSVLIDGQAIAQSTVWVSEARSHHALPAVMVPVNLQPGEHTMSLAAADANVLTDTNDNFVVSVLF